MKVTRLDLDADEKPETVHVSMSVEEAATLVKMLGSYSTSAFTEQHKRPYPYDIYSALTGSVFNPFWEDGVDDYLRGARR